MLLAKLKQIRAKTLPMAKTLQPVLVRLDPHVKAALQEQATNQRRALSNWIAVILAAHCEGSSKPAKPHVNGAAHKSAKSHATA